MVVRVGAVASVKPLKEVVDAVVVVIKVIKVVDAIVIVIACTCFFEESGLRRDGRFQNGKIDDNPGRNTGVGPHEVGERLMTEIEEGVVLTVPAPLAALVGGLDRRHAEATAVNKLGVFAGFRPVVNGLGDGEQAAGQHQKDKNDSCGKLSSVFYSLSVFF